MKPLATLAHHGRLARSVVFVMPIFVCVLWAAAAIANPSGATARDMLLAARQGDEAAATSDRRRGDMIRSIEAAKHELKKRYLGYCKEHFPDDPDLAVLDATDIESTESLAWSRGDLVLVGYSCCCRGNGWQQDLYEVIDGHAKLIEQAKLGDYQFSPSTRMRLEGNQIVMLGSVWKEDDAHCCPSLTATMTIDLETHKTKILDVKDRRTRRPYKGKVYFPSE